MPMPYLATILIALLLAVPAMSVELFRFLGAPRQLGLRSLRTIPITGTFAVAILI